MRDAKQDLSTLALSIFELNGHFLAIAEHIATQANLTATRWQILGAVENHPLPKQKSLARWVLHARAFKEQAINS